uniref:Uncharacterized protein n=4 Tax=viral metagenome TaxID=1070528 RepID=A0A6M3M1P2_9ZZZZ
MRTLQVSEEIYEKIKEQLEDINYHTDLIGKAYFFRTVTFHSVGRVVKVIGQFLELEEASWVADSGRFMQAIQNGQLNEVEPVGTAFVNIQSIVDFFPWKHALPKEQK